jgi:hypothetical protein
MSERTMALVDDATQRGRAADADTGTRVAMA